MRIIPMFAWYDCWIGIFIDRKKRCVYIFPFPMIGLKIQFAQKCEHDYSDKKYEYVARGYDDDYKYAICNKCGFRHFLG